LVHWVDLYVHTLFWAPIFPTRADIKITFLDSCHYDENLSIQITADNYYSASISFTCLAEPVTGVHELLEFSTSCFTARINNFKDFEVDCSGYLTRRTFSTKQAGHLQAIRQPFSPFVRNDLEILVSELFVAHLYAACSSHLEETVFSFTDALSSLN